MTPAFCCICSRPELAPLRHEFVAHNSSPRLRGLNHGPVVGLNMPCNRPFWSPESGPIMLTLSSVGFAKTLGQSAAMGKERMQKSPATLGDVLYARSKAPVPEQDWAALVQSIAAGDQLALHALYERAHRMVFTLIMRITANRETAEELTIDVFHDVWRRASRYDAANGTVLGWVMNQARSRAIDRLRFENRKKRSHGGDVPPLAEVTADPRDVL